MVVESLTIHFIEPVQMESNLLLNPQLLDAGRLYAKLNVDIYNGRKLVSQGIGDGTIHGPINKMHTG